MTILTKPSLGAKMPTGTEAAVAVENGSILDQDPNGNNDNLFLLQTRARRMSSVSTVLLLLATVCLICMGILTGLIIYRRFQPQATRFHGFCGIPYNADYDDQREFANSFNQKFQSLREIIAQDLENAENAEKLQSLMNDLNNSQSDQDVIFREEFDLDMDENVSKISVPDFRDGRVGRFLHDFKNNQTAIIDESSKRCFVMPLDRDAVLPPQSLADLIQKMYQGYYDINTTAIRKNMRVVLPALDDLTDVSPKVQSACDDMDIYRLEKSTNGVFKRSADLTHDGKFAVFSGNGISEYNIENIHHLNHK